MEIPYVKLSLLLIWHFNEMSSLTQGMRQTMQRGSMHDRYLRAKFFMKMNKTTLTPNERTHPAWTSVFRVCRLCKCLLQELMNMPFSGWSSVTSKDSSTLVRMKEPVVGKLSRISSRTAARVDPSLSIKSRNPRRIPSTVLKSKLNGSMMLKIEDDSYQFN